MRKMIFMALLVLSCNDNNTDTKMATNNIELVYTYFQQFNNHDWKKMAKMYAESASFKDPYLGDGIVKMTHAQVVSKYSELNQIFPDIKDSIVQIYPSGNEHVITEFVSSGSMPDGSRFELPVCTIFTITNGKITKDFSYFDNFEE